AAEILNTPAAMQIRTLDSMVMMARTAGTKVMFVPVNQDYSNGSINAFGGAGSTLGINSNLGPKLNTDATAHPGSGNPIAQPVKDSVIYSQLAEM
ncbi:hypothetical protein IWW50_003029, partial [Coemansia erecta]